MRWMLFLLHVLNKRTIATLQSLFFDFELLLMSKSKERHVLMSGHPTVMMSANFRKGGEDSTEIHQ